MKHNKKVFVSSNADRGILVKILKGKVSLSFWGNDDPKNVSYSNKEIKEFCKYILNEVSETNENDIGDAFNFAYEEMQRRLPRNQNL